MRIIAGTNRGLKLATPKGREVRPILDRVRESLFGVLRNDLEGANVADLFAGTGVIGLEALSRGAERCIFIERDPRCIATMKENIRRARAEDRAIVVRSDAFRSADRLAENGPLGLVFVDPPYRLLRSPRNLDKVLSLVTRLGEADILAAGATVILRSPADAAVPANVGPLTKADSRRYGGMHISLFQQTGSR